MKVTHRIINMEDGTGDKHSLFVEVNDTTFESLACETKDIAIESVTDKMQSLIISLDNARKRITEMYSHREDEKEKPLPPILQCAKDYPPPDFSV